MILFPHLLTYFLTPMNYTLQTGGDGDDELNAYFTSEGISTIEVTDSGNDSGNNKLNLECWQVACTLLSRDTFVANIQEFNADNKSVIER